MMNTYNPELIKTAIDARRQDQDALTLYWEFIQAESRGTTPYSSERVRDLLVDAYRLLYSAWQVQDGAPPFEELVDFACQRRFSDVSILLLLAEGEFQAQRHENALKLYDRALTLKALDAAGYQHLKLACFQRHPFDDFSNLLLQRCLKEYPEDRGVIQFLFSQYLTNEKYTYSSFAATIYRHILASEPDNLSARSLLCECSYRQGKYQQAVEEGEAAGDAAHHHPEILAILAKAHYEIGEYGRVVTYCREVLAKRPGRPEVQVLLATVYARNALTTNEAIKQYRMALQCAPQELFIRQALFRSYLRKLQVDEAIDECERIVSDLYETYGTSTREFRLAINEMLAEYERVIRRAPGEIALYIITARLYEAIGHFHKALIYYRTLLELPLEESMVHKLVELLEKLATFQIQNPHLYLYLGLLYHKIGRPHEAKLAFRAAMFADLDEREVEDILVRHDRSIWQYPPVLVILAHHRIVTKDILDGLIQTFRDSERDDWEGVLWVLQDLYAIDDLLVELHQLFAWENFAEIYAQILPILANNGSRYAVQLLKELLAHSAETIRMAALHTVIQMARFDHPLAAQCLVESSSENPHTDIRLELAGYYAQETSEQTTYQMVRMLHDDSDSVRLYVAQALQEREVQVGQLRDLLFTERHAEVKQAIIKLFEQAADPDESLYLAHFLSDLVARRYEEGNRNTMYTRLKQFIRQPEKPEETELLLSLIHTVGKLNLEQCISSLSAIATQDRTESVRLAAIHAIGHIGSQLGITPLQDVLHNTLETKTVRRAAEHALAQIVI